MDTERPHRTTSSNSSKNELFVCFTSRLSSSSMKLSSKSILSPSRSRDPPQISLSTSLSRRLKNNGSMKGGQASPMFPTVGKRRGCGFENPEPSSPKVTCIGQVRVKTKKQGKKMRARSKRRGEASFRKTEQGFQVAATNPDLTRQNSQSFQFQNHQNLQQECLKQRNQRWVHLPLTICEALREFSCFFPCRSSCMSSEREKEKAEGGGEVVVVAGGGSGGGDGREGSSGAAFARWMVAVQEGDGNRRGIELVVEEDVDGRENTERSHSQRRHVFEDIDIAVVEGKKHEESVGEEEEKARVSICIPPKNALLLMRCRSDPVKMAALANRFWESPVHKIQDEEEAEEDNDDEDSGEDEEEEQVEEGDEDQHIEMEEDKEKVVEGKTKDSICDFVAREEDHEIPILEQAEPNVKESSQIESRTNPEPESNEVPEANQDTEETHKGEYEDEGNENADEKDESFSCVSLPEAHADLEKPETEEEEGHIQVGEEEEKKENDESSELSSSPLTFITSESQNDDAEAKSKAEAAKTETSAEGSTEEEEEKVTADTEQAQETDPIHEGPDPGSKERERESKEERERGRLPECLLLMMCEPKLSMEVSKETWVCSTDFIRWLPERPAGKTDGTGCAKRVTADTSAKSKWKPKPSPLPPQPVMQPPRSSCSFPAAGGPAGMSMATMIEQKLVGSKSGNGYEPFVLTRCKSEPMRSSSKLAAEACFWNSRKIEPHPPPAPAGVGF